MNEYPQVSMISRILVLVFCTSFLMFPSCASNNDGIVSKTSEDDDSLLWVISGNGLKNDSYLLGTIHSFDPSEMDSITTYKSILPEIECIVSEVDLLSNPAKNKRIQKKLELLKLPTGVNIQDFYTLEEYYFIDDYMFEHSMGHLAEYNYYPAVLMEFLQKQAIIESLQAETTTVDVYLQEYAVAMNKTLLFLDSMEYQTELLSSLSLSHAFESSIEKQAEDLLTFVRSIKKSGEYLSSDDILEYIAEVASNEYSFEYENQYLQHSKRNKKWTSKIPRIIKHHPTLIAVGAAHLFGDAGLINLLRKEGYDVRQYEP